MSPVQLGVIRRPLKPSKSVRTPVVQPSRMRCKNHYAKWPAIACPRAELRVCRTGGTGPGHLPWKEFNPGGQYMANTFQGHSFPARTLARRPTSASTPVGSYLANVLGFTIFPEMFGMPSDCVSARATIRCSQPMEPVAVNPKGPKTVIDHQNRVCEKVHRGAVDQFLCSDQYCSTIPAGWPRKGRTQYQGTNHLSGFRL